MKRQTYHVALVNPDDEREVYSTGIAHAMNSAERKGMELVRAYARANNVVLTGGPVRDGQTYPSVWRRGRVAVEVVVWLDAPET